MNSAALLAAVVLAGLPACSAKDAAVQGPLATKAVCRLYGTAGNEGVTGTVTFTQKAGFVLVEAAVSGLTPGLHGFHVHEWGDLDCADATCTGAHFNPTNAPHAGPAADLRHAGDLGNLEADAQGNASLRLEDRILQLQGPNSIIGRAMIVHAKADDFTTQPTGDAGARVACGVIGIGKP